MPPPSPASTPVPEPSPKPEPCITCKERPVKTGQQYCWVCGPLARIEAELSVKCPGCNKEFGGLMSSGMCPKCDKEKDEREAAERRWQTDLVKLMGGENAEAMFRFETFQLVPGTERAVLAARNFAPMTDNLYLYGPCGRGKTHLAMAIARAAHIARFRVIITSATEFKFKFSPRRPYPERIKDRNAMMASDILVMDDIGFGKGLDMFSDDLCDMLNRRLAAGKNGLVVTSNLNLDQLAEKLGEDRLTSRFCGSCTQIEMTTETDWRNK